MQFSIKNTLYIYLFSICFQGILLAKSGNIVGIIETNSGVKEANTIVELSGTEYYAMTSGEGEFILNNIPVGTYTLIYKNAKRKGTKDNVLVEAGKTTYIEIKTLDNEPILPGDSTIKFYQIPQAVILDERSGIMRNLPGSAAYVDKMELKALAPISGNEVFRRVTGLNVVDEEGAGLRLNVGVRGLDPDRSRNVLILEDGIPVALAPYGEPELYYTPNMDRMAGVEVLKGSGSILFGPQTIGGIVNYVTADPPDSSQTTFNLRGGQGGYFSASAGYGNTVGNTGFLVNFQRKQVDNLGMTDFTINDFTTKFKFKMSEKASIGIKLAAYDESSNATYVGITQAMYDQGGSDFLRIAPHDKLTVRRYSASINHEYKFNQKLILQTTGFGYTTTRDWKREDFSNTRPNNFEGIVHGDESLPGGAIYMRDRASNRNRAFEVAGLETKLKSIYNIGSVKGVLDVGGRYLYERAFEQRINGANAQVNSGQLVEDEIRTGNALSAFAQNKLILSEKLTFTAGLRMEQFDYERNILRRAYGGVVRDTNIVANSNVLAIIPGAGLNLNLNDNLSIFTGIHRGFAPPRTKDAINTGGVPLDLDAEDSWNSELGARFKHSDYLFLEVTGFMMNFKNQIIPVSLSSGGLGTGLINGGATRHNGVEGAITIDFGKLAQSKWNFALNFNATFINATIADDRDEIISINKVTNDTTFANIKGNRTPYAPSYILSSAFTVQAPFGLGVRITGNYTGKQYTDLLNTTDVMPIIEMAQANPDMRYVQANANGTIGEMPAYMILDATLWYDIPKTKASFNLSVKNITNERYIVSRRPQGIRVGIPRFITAGFSYAF